MQRALIIGIVYLLLFGCSASSIRDESVMPSTVSAPLLTGPKKRVFISEFENRTSYGQRRLGSGISDILATELNATNGFILLERARLDAVLKEQALGLSGVISEQSAPKVGQLLGANAIVTGSVTQFGVRTEAQDLVITASKKQIASCTVDIRLVDVSTGRIVWTGSGQGEAIRKYTNYLGSGTAGGYDEALEGEALRSAIVNVMHNLLVGLEELEWSCTVAKVSGNSAYLNAGRNSNVKIGTTLLIYTPGEPILDPVTGAEIGRVDIKIGSGRIVAYFGDDGSVLEVNEGKEIVIGAICKLK